MIRTLLILAALFIVSACNNADVSSTPDDSIKAERTACPIADDAGLVTIADGLTATIRKKGYGRAVVMGDYATVNATLWLYDENADGGKGLLVWESGDEPFMFQLGQGGLIEGWTMGIECMLLGERRELIIASELAYGASGKPPVPPNSAIIYDLELTQLSAPEQ